MYYLHGFLVFLDVINVGLPLTQGVPIDLVDSSHKVGND
ncbi:MAG: hypothetical protein RLZZ280_358 [Pseudomonadota bacterium]|jgi:hypothetical protein